MRIPTSFKLIGKTIKVIIDDNSTRAVGDYGRAYYELDEIRFVSYKENTGMSRAVYERGIIHEVVHFLLSEIEEDGINLPLFANERFVDRLAGVLHQFLTTAEYDLDPRVQPGDIVKVDKDGNPIMIVKRMGK